MAVDFAALDYAPNFDMWARTITVTPIVSAPGAPSYQMRGIYDTDERLIQGLDGVSIISDQKTELDILESEFVGSGYALPVQGDIVDIPQENNIPPRGPFEIVDSKDNGGGEITLVIRLLGVAP
jgi:hypothetical protein